MRIVTQRPTAANGGQRRGHRALQDALVSLGSPLPLNYGMKSSARSRKERVLVGYYSPAGEGNAGSIGEEVVVFKAMLLDSTLARRKTGSR